MIRSPEKENHMQLSRRALCAGIALTPLLGPAGAASAQSGLSAEDRELVQRAATYLQGLTSARGRFVETGPGGRSSSGAFYLQRPGRMRFEYDAPSRLLVVSDGSNVKRWDPRLNTFQQVPLGRTPLRVFLAREIRLDRNVRIDRVTRTSDGFTITARDPQAPNQGSLTLAFGGSPLRLREWTVTDAQGQRTRVQLVTLQAASGLDADLFQLRDPTRRPSRN